jgi:hypothetical protein
VILAAAAVGVAGIVPAQETGNPAVNNDAMFRAGEDQTEPLVYAGRIHKAIGFGHTFMVTTDEGNVVIEEGRILEGLRMTDAALETAPDNAAAWKARLAALEILEERTSNSNERGWLLYGIREARYHLGQ